MVRILVLKRLYNLSDEQMEYKLSINVAKKNTIIRRIETDNASTHDSLHFDDVFDTRNTSRDVYADRAYPSEEREAWL